jgi:hypothetical protein
MLCVVARAFWPTLAMCLILGLARPAAAAFDLNDTSWEGGSELFELAKKKLGRERLEIAATLDYSKLTPKDGVVILHPDVPLDHEALSAFMRAGGRVAVLDDFGTGDSFLARFEIFRVSAPQTPARVLRDNPALPIAEPAVQLVAGQEQNRHPITQNVEGVVTNHPTVLTHRNLTAVLTIAARGEPNATLAVTGVIGPKVDAEDPASSRVPRGRLFAMGDPSSFINLMLRYPGNRRFAEGLLGYLIESDTWGEREGKLYFVANRFQQKGQFGDRGGVLSNMKQSLLDTFSVCTSTACRSRCRCCSRPWPAWRSWPGRCSMPHGRGRAPRHGTRKPNRWWPRADPPGASRCSRRRPATPRWVCPSCAARCWTCSASAWVLAGALRPPWS